jgi:hypothetical protein
VEWGCYRGSGLRLFRMISIMLEGGTVGTWSEVVTEASVSDLII